jgi:bifunctional DNase/RNase
MIEMTVDSVRVSMGNQQRVVILKDMQEERYLFIWIGQPESLAIAQELQGLKPPRPLTHDLLATVIERLGGRVASVTITELRQSVYHARITVEADGGSIEIDSRSSDAIALAVRVKCPIYATESVIAEAAVIPEEGDKAAGRTTGRAPSADDLAVYRDFINSLDILDEFGKD